MIVKFTDFVPPHFYELVDNFMNDRYSHYWLAGGRGSIKSSIASELIIIGIMSNPGTHAICTRKYKVDLHGSVYAQIIKAIHTLKVEDYFDISKSDQGAPPITYKPTGQKIFFTGLDDPEGIKSTTAPFGYIKYSWYEEVAQLSGMDKIRSANQTIRRGSDERFITFYTYNPPRNKGNWVNNEFNVLKHDTDYYVSLTNWEMLPQNLAEKWLGPDWIKDALSLKNRDPLAYKHEYLGEPVGYGTDVFKNLTIRQITDEEISHFDNIAGGLDFGFANDPAAYVRSHFDKKRRKLYIFQEIYGVEMLNRELADRILKIPNAVYEYIVCDSAEPKSVSEMNYCGLKRAIKAKKGPGSVESGTKFLQELNEIIIDDIRCPNSAREFSMAEYDVDKNGNVLCRLADKDNHTTDATRYRMELEQRRPAGW
jgi:PBSX family phage terminase large subunit